MGKVAVLLLEEASADAPRTVRAGDREAVAFEPGSRHLKERSADRPRPASVTVVVPHALAARRAGKEAVRQSNQVAEAALLPVERAEGPEGFVAGRGGRREGGEGRGIWPAAVPGAIYDARIPVVSQDFNRVSVGRSSRLRGGYPRREVGRSGRPRCRPGAGVRGRSSSRSGRREAHVGGH